MLRMRSGHVHEYDVIMESDRMPSRIVCKDFQETRRQRNESRPENLIEKQKALV